MRRRAVDQREQSDAVVENTRINSGVLLNDGPLLVGRQAPGGPPAAIACQRSSSSVTVDSSNDDCSEVADLARSRFAKILGACTRHPPHQLEIVDRSKGLNLRVRPPLELRHRGRSIRRNELPKITLRHVLRSFSFWQKLLVSGRFLRRGIRSTGNAFYCCVARGRSILPGRFAHTTSTERIKPRHTHLIILLGPLGMLSC